MLQFLVLVLVRSTPLRRGLRVLDAAARASVHRGIGNSRCGLLLRRVRPLVNQRMQLAILVVDYLRLHFVFVFEKW